MRKKIKPSIEADILVESRRRCCICYGLNRDLSIKKGQIAHLDKNNANNNYDNLAFLCFEHHDQYDSRTSQSKNFTIEEIKRYREELRKNFLTIHKSEESLSITSKKSTTDYRKEEIRGVLIELLSERGTITQLSSIALKTGLSKNTLENCLIDLAQEKIIRIDRPKGSLRRTFSLVDSDENLIVDAFIKTLGDTVIDDHRYIRKNMFEIDAIIKTTNENFVIEVKNTNQLSPNSIVSIIERIDKSRKALNVPENAKNVLLIGVNSSTIKLKDSLKQIEKTGVIVKFIEITK